MRTAEVTRKTKETNIRVSLVLDGTGEVNAATGLPFFDHMLTAMAKHGGFDLLVQAKETWRWTPTILLRTPG